jgi:hypothetical protein
MGDIKNMRHKERYEREEACSNLSENKTQGKNRIHTRTAVKRERKWRHETKRKRETEIE